MEDAGKHSKILAAKHRMDLAFGAKMGRMDDIRAALAGGADPKLRAKGDGSTALIVAASKGRLEAVRLLLPLSDPHQADTSGMTALMHAAQEGHPDCMAELLSASDPKPRDTFGRTLIFCASLSGSDDCLRMALEALGPESIDERMGGRHTALMAACQMGAASPAARLIAHGADPNLAPSRHEGGTCMHLAVVGRRMDCAMALLGHVDLTILDNEKRTAAQVAGMAGNQELHDLLLAAERAQIERAQIAKAAGDAPSAPRSPRI